MAACMFVLIRARARGMRVRAYRSHDACSATLLRRSRCTTRWRDGFRIRLRSPCKSHAEVLISLACPRRSLACADLPANAPRGILTGNYASRSEQNTFSCKNTGIAITCKRTLSKQPCMSELENVPSHFRPRFSSQNL